MKENGQNILFKEWVYAKNESLAMKQNLLMDSNSIFTVSIFISLGFLMKFPILKMYFFPLKFSCITNMVSRKALAQVQGWKRKKVKTTPHSGCSSLFHTPPALDTLRH